MSKTFAQVLIACSRSWGFAGAELIDPLPEKVQAKEAQFRAILGRLRAAQ